MEQAADKHGFLADDEMKAETEGMMRAGRSTRAEEWHDPQPSGEDEPDVDRAPDGTMTGGTPEGMSPDDVEGRSRLAASLDRSSFPAVRSRLIDDAQAHHAPDEIITMLQRLPDGREFANVNEVWDALGGGVERQRF